VEPIGEIVAGLERAGVVFGLADGELLVDFQPGQDAKTLRAIASLDDESVNALRSRLSEIREYVSLRSDFYGRALEAALLQAAEHNAPRDLLPWLRENSEGLYKNLTVSLPDLIQRLWAGRASRSTFCSVLSEFVKVHADAVAFYRFCNGDD